MNGARAMRWLLLGAAGLGVAACASIGHPEGGPRDKLPPVFLRSNPAPGSTDVSTSRFHLFFDENIKLEDPSNKVVVSPAQKVAPQISGSGHRVQIELRDTLIPNTTYTIDFADAITDLNEGNILDGCAIDFATGPAIDTLRIAGMVFEARNLEPAQGMVVGVYTDSLFADTTLRTIPLERVAKTDQYGRFTIRNLKPGSYRVVAIDDRNRDWHWDRSENIALFPFPVSPSSEQVMVQDTLVARNREDSLVQRQATHFLPDNILLTWFNEGYRPQYLRDYERTDARRATFKFGDRQDSLPAIRMLNGPLPGQDLRDVAVIEARQGLDSLVYWLRDTAVIATDSLLVEATYSKTDSLEQLLPQTDTLKLFVKNLKQLQRLQEKAAKELDDKILKVLKDKNLSDSAKTAQTDSLRATTIKWLTLKAVTSASHDLNRPLVIEADAPVASIDSLKIRLEVERDSAWLPVPGFSLRSDSVMVRRFVIENDWIGGAKYRLSADTAAFLNIFSEASLPLNHAFKVKPLEEYGNLLLSLINIPADSAQLVAELLDASDKVIDSCIIAPGSASASFHFINPGSYYVRAYHDANANGRWDPGNALANSQPEDVYYLNKKLNIRKNWDIDQEWNLTEVAVDLQKPQAIKKNKPKKRKNLDDDDDDLQRRRQNGELDDDEEEDSLLGDEWGVGSQYNNARRNNSRGSSRRKGGIGRPASARY